MSEWLDELRGRRKPHEFLFANKREPDLAVKAGTLRREIEDLLFSMGLRVPNIDKRVRHQVQIDHGFRKFFETQVGVAGLFDLYRKFLMGHDFGIDKTYFHPSAEEIYEGSNRAPGYCVAIPFLTI